MLNGPSLLSVLLVAAPLMICCPDTGTEPRAAALDQMIEQLKPLHRELGKPEPGDWLTIHDEPGQTFRQYLHGRPVTPRGKRDTIYIQPLGDFTPTGRKIIEKTAEFMAIYFQVSVTTRDDLPLDLVPAEARRVHPTWGVKQILTTWVLDDLLLPRLPDDAAAYIAFTGSDLWPGEGWNFVFGQASLRERVGVWSFHRNGDPDESEEAFCLCLLRTLKTATHETGHMFSIKHCTAYECNMCGSNSRSESDRRPLYCCPECVAKICWASSADPEARFAKLLRFCQEEKLAKAIEYYDRAMKSVRHQ